MENNKKLKVIVVTSELNPIAKAGGIGDIASSLPKFLEKHGVETKIIMPKYECIDVNKYKLKLEFKNLKVRMPDLSYKTINVYKYKISDSEVFAYLIDLPEIFSGKKIYPDVVKDKNENFPQYVLSKLALELIKIINWCPDIIQLHDGMAGLLPTYLKAHYENDKFYQNISTVFTMHNLGYQPLVKYSELKSLGLKREDFLTDKNYSKRQSVNVMAEAIAASDAINTVSPTYAKEILTKKLGKGLHELLQKNKFKFMGILNGIDYSDFDPRINKDTPVKYWTTNIDKKVENKLFLQKKYGLVQSADLPLICIISRLTAQKGLYLVDDILHDLVDMGAQFIVLGPPGSATIEKTLVKAEHHNPQAIKAEMKFDAHFAQTIYAGADMLLMPSRFEPCGLSQIIAMRFGTIPIVRKTGGLADTVTDGRTGFVFQRYDKKDFLVAIRRAVDYYYNQKDAWKEMQMRCMKEDFSWKESAKKYIQLYKKAITLHNMNLSQKNE